MRTNHLFNCTSCDKYAPNDRNHPKAGGGCRAQPPVPMMLGVGQDKLGRPAPIINSAWPGVGEADWCALHPLFTRAGLMIPKTVAAGPTSDIVPAAEHETPQ